MRKLVVFNQLSVDGYFTDAHSDMSWAHENTHDEEFSEFVQGNAQGGGELLFGRITYELMIKFWPTPMAMQMNPVVAERMNNLPKVVFSTTLKEATWDNTRLIKGDIANEVRKMKEAEGPDMVIMGSGTIVSQLANAGLVDTFQLIFNPLALGKGRTIFEGLDKRLDLRLDEGRVFKNGNVMVCYKPRG